MTTRMIRTGLAVVLGALLLAGCVPSQEDSAAAKDALNRVASGMEQQARTGQDTLPVGSILTLPAGATLKVVKVGAELAGVSAPAGQHLVVVQVDLANPASTPLALHPAADFWLSDSGGRRYAPLSMPGIPTDALPSGGKASGSLAFAVGADATNLRFGWQEQPTTTFLIS